MLAERRSKVFRTGACFLLLGVSAIPAQAKTVTLNMLHWAEKAEIDELREKIIPRFESLNPGIKVKISTTSNTEYVTKILSLLAAGKAPDLIPMEESFSQTFTNRGLLTDLESYAKRDRFDFSQFLPTVRKSLYFDRAPVGIPAHVVVNALYYNKSLFNNSGCPYPSDDWTWNDLIAAGKKLTRDTNGDGNPDIWGYTYGDWEGQWISFVGGNGGGILNSQQFGTKSVANASETIEAFTFLRDMRIKYKIATPWMYNFAEGKSAMVNDGSYMVPLWRPVRNLSFDVAVPPMSPKTGRTAARTSVLTIGISKGSKYKNEAWAFAKFLLSDYAQRRKHTTGIYAPLTREQLSWPELYPSNLQPSRGRDVFWKSLQSGMTDTGYPSERMPAVVNKYVTDALYNRADPTASMNALAKQLDGMLRAVRPK